MRIQLVAVVNILLSLSAYLSDAVLSELGYSLQRYDESPGVYYESKGVANLYSAEWRTIVYVDLGKINKEIIALRRYLHHIDVLCHTKYIRGWAGCINYNKDANEKLHQLTETEELLKQITGSQAVAGKAKRRKRGVLNFMGELSKILFGTMDETDARYYNEQIRLFEQNAEDTTTLMKQHLYVVKSSLGAINNTLSDLEYNEQLLREGVSNITGHMDAVESETRKITDTFSAKVEIEGHVLRVNNAMDTWQRKLDLLVASVGTAQKGVLQPQIISPFSLMEALMKSVTALPKDVMFPFPLSKDSAYLVLKVCNLQVYISKEVLVYVVHVPLVNRDQFDIYKLIPIPLPLNQVRFLYLDTGNSFLWIDKAREFYFMTDRYWLNTCKELGVRLYVCNQDQPLLSSQLNGNCMVKLLQSRKSVPSSCEKRIVELSSPVWTQLENNEWIYFIPTRESITILCTGRTPVDVVLSGTGKLGINSSCRGYSKSVVLHPHSATTVNSSIQSKDLTSEVNLEYECCEELSTKINLSSIHLNTNFKHIVSHLDDLNIASHKISEIERSIEEQEWERLHIIPNHSYSVLVYICFFLLGLYVIYKLYKCLRGKVECIKAITDTNRSGNIVNIKIHTSNESLATAHEDVPLREITAPDVKPGLRRSHRLRSSRSCF
jgi:hypothetical protein